MGLLNKMITGGFVAGGLYKGKRGGLVTFKGWRGKWWKRIKPGKAAVDAVSTVGPWYVGLGIAGLQALKKRRRR